MALQFEGFVRQVEVAKRLGVSPSYLCVLVNYRAVIPAPTHQIGSYKGRFYRTDEADRIVEEWGHRFKAGVR